jgi:hypothetical protein
MQNKANFPKSQIFITAMLTKNYNRKCKLDTWSKRTQSKPILPARVAGKIALPVRRSFSEDGSEVEGPVVSLSNPFYIMQKATGLKPSSRYNKAVK